MNANIPPATDGGFARWLAWRAGEMLLALRDEQGFNESPPSRPAPTARTQPIRTRFEPTATSCRTS